MLNKRLLLFILLIASGCDPFHTQFDEDEENVIAYSSKDQAIFTFPDTLNIMTWNIRYAGGRIEFHWDCYGDRAIMTEEEVTENLEGIAAKIKFSDPDIPLIQEMDILSKRCAYIDEMQWLLDNTNLNYGVYASMWKADYIPSGGIGKVNLGNAILSKWKIKDAERISLPQRTDQASYVSYFHFQRCIVKGTINGLTVLNIH